MILQQKESELNESFEKIKKIETERKEQERINDAITIWGDKIKDAFRNLKGYIAPLKKEHNRLQYLYWFYLALIVTLVIFIAFIEYKICDKIVSYQGNGLPTFKEYFSVIFPIPIALALLFAFIHEMNRSQRQLVILAKQIHEIEYVEGLLLTVNKLSTNMDESMTKVNEAINKLLDNHIKYRDNTLLDEILLKNEERKDLSPNERALRVLREVNEIISSYKK